MMNNILILVCSMKVACTFSVDDNIAMESFSGKNLDFLSYGFENTSPNRFSNFLSRAGELFSDSDFGNKIKNESQKQQITQATNVEEVSKKDERDFMTRNSKKNPKIDKGLRNLTSLVKSDKLTGNFNETTVTT